MYMGGHTYTRRPRTVAICSIMAIAICPILLIAILPKKKDFLGMEFSEAAFLAFPFDPWGFLCQIYCSGEVGALIGLFMWKIKKVKFSSGASYNTCT